ncbi:hypothetical protein LOM8899_04611 [Flavimaricola marinus]|uniref:Uncharacterized protein n=1 Tax=Flavimaricola marinus TaxID=1819565 RepID=A0A238LL99_9RHOB|nr:hypothetical protein LOM8899_04611 [Flavimaricola marinus]
MAWVGATDPLLRSIQDAVQPLEAVERQGCRCSDHGWSVTEHGEEEIVMIGATYLKAHRTATSLDVKKGGVDA